jgi:hypothetical protein
VPERVDRRRLLDVLPRRARRDLHEGADNKAEHEE